MDPAKCDHTIILKGLCGICGIKLEELNSTDKNNAISAASVSMVHSVPELRITKEFAQQLGKADQERLIEQRKLVLLVDLDQTLIHTTHEPGPNNEKLEVHKFQLWPDVPNQPTYRTKFRPHLNEFFENMSKLFEFHICTFGARMYAHKIASLLDPDQKYFAARILSRDECFDPLSKTGNMKELFPCGDSMVCIIDDREDVWNYAPNLVVVKPYTYFQSMGDINSPYEQKGNVQYQQSSGQASTDSTDNEDLTDDDCEDDDSQLEDATELEALLMQDTSNIEREDDDHYLLYLQDILRTVHKKFYEDLDKKRRYLEEGENFKLPDLKEIIPLVKRSVLAKVNAVFSGVIPTNFPQERHKAYILASSFGAKISKEIIDDGFERTTHLIASKAGTAKVSQVQRLNRHSRNGPKIWIVTPQWLYESTERWSIAEEMAFPLVDKISKGESNSSPESIGT